MENRWEHLRVQRGSVSGPVASRIQSTQRRSSFTADKLMEKTLQEQQLLNALETQQQQKEAAAAKEAAKRVGKVDEPEPERSVHRMDDDEHHEAHQGRIQKQEDRAEQYMQSLKKRAQITKQFEVKPMRSSTPQTASSQPADELGQALERRKQLSLEKEKERQQVCTYLQNCQCAHCCE